jgi:hypothetical protein
VGDRVTLPRCPHPTTAKVTGSAGRRYSVVVLTGISVDLRQIDVRMEDIVELKAPIAFYIHPCPEFFLDCWRESQTKKTKFGLDFLSLVNTKNLFTIQFLLVLLSIHLITQNLSFLHTMNQTQ